MPIIIDTKKSIDEIITLFLLNPEDSTWTTQDPQDNSSDAFTKFCDNIGNLIAKCSNI